MLQFIRTMILKPSEIYYSQDSISKTFDRRSSHNSYTIGQTLDEILSGQCGLKSIPKISVLHIPGEYEKWFSVDNRRLWVFKQLQRVGYCETIEVNVSYYNYRIHGRKFTTVNGGASIRIRGDPGGKGHRLPDYWFQQKKLQVEKAQNERVTTQYKEKNIKIKRAEDMNRSNAKTALCDKSKRNKHEALKNYLNDENMHRRRLTDHGSSTVGSLRQRLRPESPVSFYNPTNDELHRPTKHNLLEESNIKPSRKYDTYTIERNIELKGRMKPQRRTAETDLTSWSKNKQHKALKHHLNDENMYHRRMTDHFSSSDGSLRQRLRPESPVSFYNPTNDELHRPTKHNLLEESNIKPSRKYDTYTVERNIELEGRMKPQRRTAKTDLSATSKYEVLKHRFNDEAMPYRILSDQVSSSNGMFRERLLTEGPVSLFNPTNDELHHPPNNDLPRNLVKQRMAILQNEQCSLNTKPAEAEIKLEKPYECANKGVYSKERHSSREASDEENTTYINSMVSKYAAELHEKCFITKPRHAVVPHNRSSKDLSSGPTIPSDLRKIKDQRKESHFQDAFHVPSKQDHVYKSRSTTPKEKVKIAWNDHSLERNSDHKTHVARLEDDLCNQTVSLHKKHHSENQKHERPEEKETRKSSSNTTPDTSKIMKMSFAHAEMDNVDPLGEKRVQSPLFTRTFPRKLSEISTIYPGNGIFHKSIPRECNWSTETLYGSSDDSSVSSIDI